MLSFPPSPSVRIFIAREATPFPEPRDLGDHPLRAAVSGFGFGGITCGCPVINRSG